MFDRAVSPAKWLQIATLAETTEHLRETEGLQVARVVWSTEAAGKEDIRDRARRARESWG
jgi:hypothetical protein